jgi:hypothetical protein
MAQEYFLGDKGGRCLEVTNFPPYADCIEIWEPQTPGTITACPGLDWDCFTFYHIFLVFLFCSSKLQYVSLLTELNVCFLLKDKSRTTLNITVFTKYVIFNSNLVERGGGAELGRPLFWVRV